MKTMEEKFKKQIVSAVATVLTEYYAQHPSREDELEKALSIAESNNKDLTNRLLELHEMYERLEDKCEEWQDKYDAEVRAYADLEADYETEVEDLKKAT